MIDAGFNHENLSKTKPIESEQLSDLVNRLISCRENQQRLDVLEVEKRPYLFKSDDLLTLVRDVTPSVKTRLSMISIIGPRLVDPREKSNELIEIFRFAEEKEKVEAILKDRAHKLNSSSFKNTAVSDQVHRRASSALSKGGRGRGPRNVINREFNSLLRKESNASLTTVESDYNSTSYNSPGDTENEESSLNGGYIVPRKIESRPEVSTRISEQRPLPQSFEGHMMPDMASISPRSTSPITVSTVHSIKSTTLSIEQMRSSSQRVPAEPRRENKVVSKWLERDRDNGKEKLQTANKGIEKKKRVGRLNILGLFKGSDDSKNDLSKENDSKIAGIQKLTVSVYEGYSSIFSPTKDKNHTNEAPKRGSSMAHDVAGKSAEKLGLSRTEFLSLDMEGPILKFHDNTLPHWNQEKFSYKELLRRNFYKHYGDLIKIDLEKYLTNEEFQNVFHMDFSSFEKMPKWKQIESKKKALLF